MKRHLTINNFLIFISVYYVLASAFASGETTGVVKIAAFNIQIFGRTKMSKPEVVDILVKIIRRYDIVLIQEIRDITGEAIVSLLEQVNDSSDHNFKMSLSERLGRTSSKEQYAYFFRNDIDLEVLDEYQFPDPEDKFEREPFNILVKVPNLELEQMVLVGIHVKPDDAENEIDALIDVHNAVSAKWSTDNIELMGDFNAASPYLTQTENDNLQLRDSQYNWLIPDTLDTTVATSNKAYDRFVITGDELNMNIVPYTAKAFRFDDYYELDADQAKDVSDHYPIEFDLYRDSEQPQISSGVTVTGFQFQDQLIGSFVLLLHYEL